MEIAFNPEYTFTRKELASLHGIVTRTGSTREAFKVWWAVEEGEFTTEHVEDFAIAFMAAYNRIFPRTF
jgi:hypothetical protein